MRATTTATVRLSQSAKKHLASAARRRGMSLSRYLLESAQQAASTHPIDPPLSPVALDIEKMVRPSNSIPEEA
jgi:hypothetical protein